MTELPVFTRTVIQDEDKDPCKGCAARDDWHSGLRCKQVSISRYDLEDAAADQLDPVELMVVADPPSKDDEAGKGYWTDRQAKSLLRLIKSAGFKSFAVVPSVRCYPGEDIQHFELKKKYRQERGNKTETAMDSANAYVENCKQFTERARLALEPKMTLALGPHASQALGMGGNIYALRSKPLHPKKGIAAASKKQGTVVTWDRSFAKVSLWGKMDVENDIGTNLPNLNETGYATPDGDHATIKQTVLDTVPKVKKFVDICLGVTRSKTKALRLTSNDMLCFDFETDNMEFNTETNRILNVGFAFRRSPDKSYIVPLAHPETPFSADDLEEVNKHLARLFRGEGARWKAFVAHNAQFEVAITKTFFDVWLGEEGGIPVLDTMLLAHLTNENRAKKGINRPYSLETLGLEYLGFRWYSETGIKTRRDRLAEEPLAKVNEYVGMDAAVTARLFNNICRRMKDEERADKGGHAVFRDLMNVSFNLYSKAILYTVDMQLNGQEVDIPLLLLLRGPKSSIGPRLKEIKDWFENSSKVRKAMKSLNSSNKAGPKPLFKTSATKKAGQFDLNKPDHRKALFWNVMRLKGADKSVDSKFQDRYEGRYDEVKFFREYQKLSKLDSAYLAPIAKFVQSSPDGRLHPSFNLTQTVSGRLSAKNPNCYDHETEILTPNGWVLFPDLKDDDKVAQWAPETDSIEFVVPAEVVRCEYDGPMVSLQSQNTDLVVTPNHRCVVRSKKTGKLKVYDAEKFPKTATWEHMHSVSPSAKLTEAEALVVAAALGGGKMLKGIKKGSMQLTLDPSKTEAVEEALKASGAKYVKRGNGFIVTKSVALAVMTNRVEGDFELGWALSLGREAQNYLVAALEELGLDSSPVLEVGLSVSENDTTDVADIASAKVAYKHGTVYCVAVSSSYVVVRRNGKVSISGNTQQVPRGDTRDKKQIKSLFTVPEDKIMVQLDFSQAEVRWLGVLSGDDNLAERYATAQKLKDELRADPTNKELQRKVKIEGDLHMSTAIDMYKLDPDTVVNPETGEQTKEAKLKRQNAKAVCFGLIYGKTSRSLAKDLGIEPEEAEEAVALWMGQFPKAAAWLENVDEEIGDTCVSVSPFGRRRRLPEAASEDVSVANSAKRQARNTPIQSAASDFCIYAAATLRSALRTHKDPKVREIKLINTVHDSVAAEVPADFKTLKTYMTLAKKIFTNPRLIEEDFAIRATVPLSVDFEAGISWANCREVEIVDDEIEAVLYDTEVLRNQPAGTLMADLEGKGLLFHERA